MGKKLCTICCSEVTSFMVTPKTCALRHSEEERACADCWEAHLSSEINAKHPSEIKCMFCKSDIQKGDIKRLARPLTFGRYNGKLKSPDGKRFMCQQRCPESNVAGAAPHDRQDDGRVFTCRFCKFETCIDCDRPEHTGDTCTEYRTRSGSNLEQLAISEAAVADLFKCPGCDMPCEFDGGCGHTACCACGYRFCSRCLIPWVGEKSAYLGGKEAHLVGCLYRYRDTDSKHTLQNRFQADAATEERVEARKAANKAKNEARKAAKAAQVAGDRDEEKVLPKSEKNKTGNGQVEKRKRAGFGDGIDDELLSRKSPKKDPRSSKSMHAN